MTQPSGNPYQASSVVDTAGPLQHRWLNWLVGGVCVYYLASAATLPFANNVWIGEAPILAIVQLPKAFLKSIIHHQLLQAVQLLGWSRGSASPDYSMTHLWAMLLTVATPVLLLTCVIRYFRSGRGCLKLIVAVLACSMLDALVTLWFDNWSQLKLYNGSFL